MIIMVEVKLTKKRIKEKLKLIINNEINNKCNFFLNDKRKFREQKILIIYQNI